MKIYIYPDSDQICAIIRDAIEALPQDIRSKRRCGVCLSTSIKFLDDNKSSYKCKECDHEDFYPWWEDCQAYKDEIVSNEYIKNLTFTGNVKDHTKLDLIMSKSGNIEFTSGVIND